MIVPAIFIGLFFMIVLPLFLGLFFMFASYIFISLAGATLLSYCSKKILEAIYLFFSIPARLKKQMQNFRKKRDYLKYTYYKKNQLIWKKTISKQQSLHDKNTKNQLRLLVKSTKKQLHLNRNHLSYEQQKEIQRTIKQCISQLDMVELLKINFRLLALNQQSHLVLIDTQNQ